MSKRNAKNLSTVPKKAKSPVEGADAPEAAGSSSEERTEEAAGDEEAESLTPADLVPKDLARTASIYLALVAEAMSDVGAGARNGLGLTLGGVMLNAVGMVYLLTKQTNKAENGLYQVRAGDHAQLSPSVTSGGVLIFVGKGAQWWKPNEGDFGTAISNWTQQT